MNRSGSYSYDAGERRRYQERGGQDYNRKAVITEVWAMNMIAIGLALAALALFVVGMIVGTGVTSNTNSAVIQAQQGAVWLLGAISLAITAAIFRREHHVVDPEEYEYREQETEQPAALVQ